MRKNTRSLAVVVLLGAVVTTMLTGAAPRAQARLGGTIQLMTWSAGSGWLPAFRKIAAAFTSKHPGTSVQVIVLPYDQWTTKFTLLAATHSEPDVFQQDTSMWTLFDQGLAADLRPYIASDPTLNDPKRFFTHAWASVPTLHGQILSAPVALSDMVLYYNRDLFAKAGIAEPNDNWTWNDVLAAAKKLTLDSKGRTAADKAFDPTSVVQFGIDPGDLHVYWGYWTLIWENGGDIFDHNVNPTTCTLTSPAAVKSLQYVADLTAKYHVAPLPQQNKALPGGGGFGSGRVAMSFDGDWSFATYATLKSFKWDVTQPPKGPLGRKNTFWSGDFSMSSHSKNKELSWAFIRYMAEDPQAQAMFANLGVGVPVLNSTAHSPAFLHPTWAPAHYSERLKALEGARFGEPLFPGWGEVQTRYWSPFQDKLWAGKVTAAQAAQQICAGTNAFLKKIKY